MSLIVDNICKSIRGKKIVSNVSFNIESGNIFALIGQNGAGKTTTIKCILNFLRLDEGRIRYKDKSIKELFNNSSAVGYSPETLHFAKTISLYSYLYDIGQLKGIDTTLLKTKIHDLTEEFDLADFLKANIDTFSKGMKRKVVFIQSLLSNPEFLVLDEPTDGLDPISRQKVLSKIRGLSEQGTIILITSHLLSDLEKVSDEICVISKGEIIERLRIKDCEFYKEIDSAVFSLDGPETRNHIISRGDYYLEESGTKSQILSIKTRHFSLDDWYYSVLQEKGRLNE